MSTKGVCTFTANHATYFAAVELTSGIPVVVSDDGKKKELPKNRDIRNSRNKLSQGSVLTQSGKRFSKNSEVKLYFSRYGGGYYDPMTVKTNKSGAFSTSYAIHKPAGTYKWYALDTKTGKKVRLLVIR